MRLRPAVRSDASDIRRVHELAFGTDAEADLVERLVCDGDARISIVCLEQGRIVGHVLFSRMEVEADGQPVDALGLAPVAVVPERQGNGIGSALIEAGVAEARRLGTEVIFVLGDTRLYRRFGFEGTAAKPFACRYAGPHLQALLLNEAMTPAQSGRASYAPAFEAL